MNRPIRDATAPTVAGAVLLALNSVGMGWLVVTRSDPFWGLGVLATLAFGALAVPLLLAAGVLAFRGREQPGHVLAATGLAAVVGGLAGASLGGLALHQERVREASYQRAQAAQRAQIEAAGAPLRTAMMQCADAALHRDEIEPVRGARYLAAHAFVRSVLDCGKTRPEAGRLGFDCTPRAGDICSMPVQRHDGAPEIYSIGPERQREVFLARRNVNDKTFQERFGDRCTSGEVNPYAPGFREGDCTQR